MEINEEHRSQHRKRRRDDNEDSDFDEENEVRRDTEMINSSRQSPIEARAVQDDSQTVGQPCTDAGDDIIDVQIQNSNQGHSLSCDGSEIESNECGTNVDEEENETKTKRWIDKALSVELIVIEIFKNLTIPQLLLCSLVNKFWHLNARSVLRDYKKCYAAIKGSKPCELLTSLNTILESSFSIPFNGLLINPHDDADEDSSHGHGHLRLCTKSTKNHECPQQLYPQFFDSSSFKLKYLKFYWKESNICYNASQFILTLLSSSSNRNAETESSQNQSQNLVELSIGEFPREITSLDQFLSLLDTSSQKKYLGIDIETSKFKFLWPRLKSLELPTVYNKYMDSLVIKDLLQCAPNLSVLRGHVLPEYLDHLVNLDRIKVKEFVLAFPIPQSQGQGQGQGQGVQLVNDAIDRLLESALSFAHKHPSLERLSIATSHDRLNQRILRQNPRIISDILEHLFHSSYTTLHQLQLDYQDFKSLTRVQILSPSNPLWGLKNLTLKYDDSIDFYAHFNFVDLSPMFPLLERIEFIGSCFTTRGFYLASLFRERYSGFTCESVKTLKIFHLHIFSKFTDADGRFIRRISEFFPSVRELHCDDYGDDSDFFDIVFSVWGELDVIHFYSVPEPVAMGIGQGNVGEEGGGGGPGAGDYSFDPFYDGIRMKIKTFQRKSKTP